jgi:hypothetical protein
MIQSYPELPRRWKEAAEGAFSAGRGRDASNATIEHLYKVSLVVRGLMIGQANNVLEVTLAPGATSTVVSDPRIPISAKAFLTARSASAAAATGLWVEAGSGKVTLHHDATADTDRHFGLLFAG